MKKIINAVIGDPKNASPAKKYAAYALLGTAIAFVLALVILIVSSIAFAIVDGNSEIATPSDASDNSSTNNSTVNSSNITYGTITADELDEKTGELVDLTTVRSDLDQSKGNYYYAKKNTVNINEYAMDALDDMLVAFYKANTAKLVTDINQSGCNIPLVLDAGSEGLTFNIVVFHDDSSISGNATYQWIFDNAYSYGFIYSGNSFRYVGVAAANYMKVNAKTVASYESFVNVLKTNTKGNISATVTSGKNKISYQMYYLAADAELKVPTNYEYTVIADGTNGYIVTVNMSKAVQTATTDGGVG